MAKKGKKVDTWFTPIIQDDGRGNFKVRCSRKQGYRVRNAFPSATTEDEKTWIVEQTVTNSNKMTRLWPNALWLTRKMTKKNEDTFAHKVQRNIRKAKESTVNVESVTVGNHPHWDSLFDFQRTGVEFLAARHAAFCGDEMGLGKTVQAIVTVDIVSPEGRVMVVAPNTLLENWEDEIIKWQANEDKPIFILKGNPDRRRKILEEVEELDSCWLIVNWEALRLHTDPNAKKEEGNTRDDALSRIQFGVVIADEAHRAKNRKAQQTIALKRIRAERKYALTGTPVMNRPDELWSILNWFDKTTFSSYWRFFEDYIEYEEGYFGKEILGTKNAKELSALLSSRMIRRLKKDVYKDLPDKVHKTIRIDLSPAQKKAYKQMSEELITQIADGTIVTAQAVVAQLLRLQQICVSLALLSTETDSSKFQTLFEIMEDAGDSKVVIFSRFAKACEALARDMVARGYSVVYLTGDHTALIEPSGEFDKPKVTKVSRGEAVKAFQNNDQFKVYIGTTQSGGVGITLTAADTVIFLDKMWTPADQKQAEDRLHRIGQKKSVQVISLLVNDSIEQYVERTLEKKEEIVAAIMRKAEESGKPVDAEAKAEKLNVTERVLSKAQKQGKDALVDAVSKMVEG